jgi:hypothetical protein
MARRSRGAKGRMIVSHVVGDPASPLLVLFGWRLPSRAASNNET